MDSDSGKRAKESDVRDRRYAIAFAADVEMLELESGTRVSCALRVSGVSYAAHDRKPVFGTV